MSLIQARSLWEKYRISQIRATAAVLLSLPLDTPKMEAQLSAVLDEAREIDNEVSIWAEQLASPCRPQVWRLDSNDTANTVAELPDAHQEGQQEGQQEYPNLAEPSVQHIFAYADIWFPSLWHGHRTSHLILNETIIRLARRLNLTSEMQDAIKVILQMLQETSASITISLGDVEVYSNESGHESMRMNIDSSIKRGGGAGAYFVIWTLRHVVSCEFASGGQILEASQALLRIGVQFGVKQAFTLASRQYQCHPSINPD